MPGGKRALWRSGEVAGADYLAFERSLWDLGYQRVAGTDEAGRGPLAGPVVAACVLLPRGCPVSAFRDSKQLSAPRRREIAVELAELPGVMMGVGVVSAEEIDRVNILRASLQAMALAVRDLNESNGYGGDEGLDFLLVDGRFKVPITLPQQTMVKGDCRSATVAAASIIAKVRRDAIMADYHRQYPQYNFIQHQGYGTAEHLRLLRLHGPSPIHRRSFRPVRLSLESTS